MKSFNLSPEKNHLQIPYQNQQRLTSLISKGLGLFVSPAFGFMSGKGEPSGTVILQFLIKVAQNEKTDILAMFEPKHTRWPMPKGRQLYRSPESLQRNRSEKHKKKQILKINSQKRDFFLIYNFDYFLIYNLCKKKCYILLEVIDFGTRFVSTNVKHMFQMQTVMDFVNVSKTLVFIYMYDTV